MKKHNGMRPQDIVILAKVILMGEKEWLNKELSEQLYISPGEISESLNRSRAAKLIDPNKKRVNRHSFYEFISHGLSYVFPAELGTLQRGIGTAHSHTFMQDSFESTTAYVWPDYEGAIMGLAVEPLYNNQTKAIKADPSLYKMLALIDSLRIGKAREIEIAAKELHKMIINE
ncbi:hypothetical protein BH09BAC1_BH09BAC1_04440 [soil metagenome]